MNRKVINFKKLCSENFDQLIDSFKNGRSFSYPSRIWSIIHNLLELGKRLSKVDHKTCGRKKSKRCINACKSIMFWMMTVYSNILKEKVVYFDQIVQVLYGFSQEMALLLCNIAFDIVLDQRFKQLLAIASEVSLDLWSVFFGKVKVSSFTFPKRLYFYLNLFSIQCICARSNPRKRLLTTSGFVNILIHKFGIQRIFPKRRNPNNNRKLLFKCI